MSLFTKGKLIDTVKYRTKPCPCGGSHHHAQRSKVYNVEENKQVFDKAPDYYQYMVSVWEKVAAEGEAISFTPEDLENLIRICTGGYYSVDVENSIYVDNWNVNEENLFHRHPEFGPQYGYPEPADMAELEWDVNGGQCTMCGVKIPDTVWFIHKMYQL